MAWLGTAELASAVSNAGGLGILGPGNASGDWVRQEIRRTRELTDRPFGVNIMFLSPFAKEVVEAVIEEKPAVATAGAGNAGPVMARLKEAGIKVIPVVASVALAMRLARSGADAVIAEGMESGGHVGELTTMALVPQVVDALSIPVVAAGGIADGRGLVAALALGAAGVQMGTRFVCASECIAHPNFKQRIIQNRMSRQFAAMEKAGVPPEDLEAFGAGKLRRGLIDGEMDEGSLMAGQISGLIKDIKPAREIIEDIMAEAREILLTLTGLPVPAAPSVGAKRS